VGLPEKVNRTWVVANAVRIGILLFAALIVAVVRMLTPAWETHVDESLTDLIWRTAASERSEQRVILVDIGESSLKETGPWPWPRSTMAALSSQLSSYGVKQQIYDIIFESPREGDVDFARQLKAADATLAQVFVVDHGKAIVSGHLIPGGGLTASVCPKNWAQASGYIAPTEQLSTKSAGHITPRIDPDGAVRKLPAMVCYQGVSYPALSLAAIKGSQQWELKYSDGWFSPAYSLQEKGALKRSIPLSETGDIRVPYRIHPNGFIAIEASDILTGNVPKDLLKGSIVLIGSTALGANDAVPTPFNGATTGMLIHAETMVGILDQRIPYTPKAAIALQVGLFATLGFGLILLAAQTRRTPIFLPLVGVASAVVVIALHSVLLISVDLWIPWSTGALSLLLATILLAIYEHWLSRIEKERLFTHLASYLPAAVASTLAGQQPSGMVQAERREVTVLIADIRNFSAYCESAPAEEVAAVLHAFIVTAQQIIEEQGGVVEAVQGDSIMALWPQPDVRAVHAAQMLLKLSHQFLPDTLADDLEPLALGVGLEAGSALVGSVGPLKRRTHTAMGVTVTTAARLQGMTADLAEGLLIGPELAKSVPEQKLRDLGKFLLEGMRRPQNVFSITS
jgi:adenylate cyclase